jgi:hypothetical protein
MTRVKQTIAFFFVSLLLFISAPASAMQMYVSGDQLIITGPIYGFELTQFGAAITSNVKTVVFYNSSGGEFAAGVNLAFEIRRRGLSTVAKGYCSSSCGNAFLGGVERRLADSRSYVAVHGVYNSYGHLMLAHVGELRRFYDEMTGGKVNDDLVQLWLKKPLRGLVYFLKHQTYSCNGNEEKRPSGCAQIPQTALEMGIITSLDDVEVRTAD